MTVFLLWITCFWMKHLKRFHPKAKLINSYLIDSYFNY
ncbi:hypothetical protein J582_3531 [Acinetobacter sp. 1566109]|nr:hypothetical protein J582_3531 [Acinetobacter sp. 1566109]